MNRKNFITKSGIALGGGLLAPYILPSGRLFAKTGSVKADHVVLVMFAGGVRQQESVLGRYLEDSQGVTGAAGNIMPNCNSSFSNRGCVSLWKFHTIHASVATLAKLSSPRESYM